MLCRLTTPHYRAKNVREPTTSSPPCFVTTVASAMPHPVTAHRYHTLNHAKALPQSRWSCHHCLELCLANTLHRASTLYGHDKPYRALSFPCPHQHQMD
ncbi:hypothetical protein NL676_004691 [Syzygium grande]|nr:hypothetical protein NL676_004691 [Syzygium grande]